MILGVTRTAHLWRWPIVESVVALRTLHEAGVPIGVVSNAAGQIESVLGRFGVCQVGEGEGVPVVIIVDSTIVGVAKPDPAIFSFALDVLDVKPEHVAYVGDSYANDVVGARAAGMRPFLLDPYDDHAGADYDRIKGGQRARPSRSSSRRAMTLRVRISSVPSKMESTRASTNSRLTGYSSA